jgi:hypothetical protein
MPFMLNYGAYMLLMLQFVFYQICTLGRGDLVIFVVIFSVVEKSFHLSVLSYS